MLALSGGAEAIVAADSLVATAARLPIAAVDPVTVAVQPALPQVSDVLHKASITVDAFALRAASMQQKVLAKQNASKTALAKSKARYEEELRSMDKRIAKFLAANAVIRDEIAQLANASGVIKLEAERFNKSNYLLWSSFGHLQTKMDAATQFTADSLRLSDLSGSPDLAVLSEAVTNKTVAAQQSLDNFLKLAMSMKPVTPPRPAVASNKTHATNPAPAANKTNVTNKALPHGSSARPKTSLLQIQMPAKLWGVSPAGPAHDSSSTSRRPLESYIPLLLKSLEDLSAAEIAGEKKLKAQFDDFAAERKARIEELYAEQQALSKRRTEQRTVLADMTKARDHLKDMRHQLLARIRGLREFATKIGTESVEVMKDQRALNPAAPPAAVTRDQPEVVSQTNETGLTNQTNQTRQPPPGHSAPAKGASVSSFFIRGAGQHSDAFRPKTSASSEFLFSRY